MAYGAILTIACVILAFRYAFISGALLPSKCVVVGMAIGSFFIPWPIATILTRLGVSLYVILYLKAFPPGGASTLRHG